MVFSGFLIISTVCLIIIAIQLFNLFFDIELSWIFIAIWDFIMEVAGATVVVILPITVIFSIIEGEITRNNISNFILSLAFAVFTLILCSYLSEMRMRKQLDNTYNFDKKRKCSNCKYYVDGYCIGNGEEPQKLKSDEVCEKFRRR